MSHFKTTLPYGTVLAIISLGYIKPTVALSTLTLGSLAAILACGLFTTSSIATILATTDAFREILGKQRTRQCLTNIALVTFYILLTCLLYHITTALYTHI